MNVWTFRQIESKTGRKVIDDWRKGLSPARRATFDLFLHRIAKMQSWPNGICDPLAGHPSCRELRWKAEKVQHRIFGYFDVGNVFVMLVGCTHKGKVYDPPGAFETLKERKGRIDQGKGTLVEYTIWEDNQDAG